ncbi:MAG: hypothetical protein H6R01_518 [Burkholderiaceae bacterium]|nr:hypothetical protein [Burkholderiaceae bacterium]
MKHRLWLRQLSISSPTMIIKSQLPKPVRLGLWLLSLVVAGVLALWIYDLGRGLAGNPEDRDLRAQIAQIKAERDQLAKSADSTETRQTIDRVAQSQLSEQIKALEAENARLKEDLAYFDSLLPANTGTQGVTIQRLSLESSPPNQLRFRLLVMQGGSGKQRFSGELQLVVTAEQGGQSISLVYPKDRAADADKYKIGFRHYQRLEGVLTLPEGVVVKNVEARVMERGQVRAQKSAGL